ncbi:MAG: hypothetical protein M0Q37_11205, partial [Sphaerochaeta sp.]|nr:hypothetical protein [Sphaerochaeta sp.]
GERFPFSSSNAQVEWTWYPHSRRLVVANGSEEAQHARIEREGVVIEVALAPWAIDIIDVD